jgi:hypothetical protein
MEKAESCGCAKRPVAGVGESDKRQPWVVGSVTVNERKIPVVSTRLSRRDVIGGWLVRWDIGRMRYSVPPGLYAVGKPTPESPVLVTANYKLTFDRLRKELEGINAWLLALDTKGINVWCAAGKGTFGTRELELKLMAVGLERIVSHRTLILPQLGASGVSAPEVRAATGWRVKYGPVRARDIPAYLSNGLKKDDAMRRVEFRLADRMAIAPAELSHSWPVVLAVIAGSALFALPLGGGYLSRLLKTCLPILGAVIMGTLVFPALLPILPFRAFSLKGAVLGVLWGVAAAFVVQASLPVAAALILIAAPIAAFLSMNFTGASTFTCQPGAELEVRRGAIPMIVTLVLGVGLDVAAKIMKI